MSTTKTDTLKVPGATLHYEVSGSGPVLLLIPGAPADAGAFGGLTGVLSQKYTVVTYDTRGTSRSPLDGPADEQNLDVHGDDAHRVLEAVTSEPAYVLGCSGGALIGLNLVARHPEQVRTLVAHEPPLLRLLPDSERWLAAFEGVYETYAKAGAGPAMMQFIATAEGGPEAAAQGHEPPQPPPMPDFSQMPPEALEAMGRMQANSDFFLSRLLPMVNDHTPDIDGLRAAQTRVVVAVGEESQGQMPNQTGVILAERIDAKVVDFPGNHQGFALNPVGFAEAVDQVLSGS
ncbi:alpha/beta fold hydrolase [Streptosporangium sp. NPDC000396]|uniref:alpha/beta fold hydrolase n=1 Tax=Streptosporangium sp. NPDC000396 TaxID=3366185 RepID=UPI0036C95CF8